MYVIRGTAFVIGLLGIDLIIIFVDYANYPEVTRIEYQFYRHVIFFYLHNLH